MAGLFDRVTAHGLGGTRYQFEVYPAATEFRAVPGLYFFGHPTANGGWRALYIGQTHDLQMRVGSGLKNHHQLAAATRLGMTHIGVHVFHGPEEARLQAESGLIAVLQPRLNATLGAGANVLLRRS